MEKNKTGLSDTVKQTGSLMQTYYPVEVRQHTDNNLVKIEDGAIEGPYTGLEPFLDLIHFKLDERWGDEIPSPKVPPIREGIRLVYKDLDNLTAKLYINRCGFSDDLHSAKDLNDKFREGKLFFRDIIIHTPYIKENWYEEGVRENIDYSNRDSMKVWIRPKRGGFGLGLIPTEWEVLMRGPKYVSNGQFSPAYTLFQCLAYCSRKKEEKVNGLTNHTIGDRYARIIDYLRNGGHDGSKEKGMHQYIFEGPVKVPNELPIKDLDALASNLISNGLDKVRERHRGRFTTYGVPIPNSAKLSGGFPGEPLREETIPGWMHVRERTQHYFDDEPNYSIPDKSRVAFLYPEHIEDIFAEKTAILYFPQKDTPSKNLALIKKIKNLFLHD